MRQIALFFSVFLTACGGSVAADAASTGNGTPGTTTDSGVRTGGDATISEDAPLETAVDAPRICNQTRDTATIRIVHESGGVDGCEGAPSTFPPSTPYLFGQIVELTTDTIVFDTCPPNADCATPGRTTLQVDAAGLDLRSLPKSSFVKIEAIFGKSAFGCTQAVEVHSVAEWGGVTNPADVGDNLYLTAVDGEVGRFEELLVTKVAQGCLPGVKACGGPDAPDDYFMRISSAVASVDAYMGSDAPGPLVIGPGNAVRVKNLRSFYDGACDAYGNYAFWAVRAAP